MGVNERGLGRLSFRPKSPQKGQGHLKHDFRLTERLLPDSTMTYRGRSDSLVVESDRKKKSFSRRQCVALIAFMDKPHLNYIVEMNISIQNIRSRMNISGISSVACWVCDCVCVCR